MATTKTQPVERLARFANIVLVSGGVLCVLILLYSLYYYGLTGTRSFTGPTGMVLYCGVPALLAGALFAALRLETFKRINIALLLVSIGLSIHAANLVLALADVRLASANRTLWFRPGDLEDLVAVAREHDVAFDTRSKLQVINDLKAEGIHAVPSIVPLILLTKRPDATRKSAITLDGVETLPHGGISNRVTVHCNEAGKYVIYESDEHGFHNPKGIWGTNSLDIVALGDSFTQGSCVPSDKNFVSVIREHYPKTLNLGMSGQGPLNTLATLKDYVQALKPNVVLWFFFEGNDVADLFYERQSPLLMRYLDGGFSQRLGERQTEIDQALATYIEGEAARSESDSPRKASETLDRARRLLERLVKLSPLRQRLGLVYGDSPESGLADASVMDLFDRAVRETKATVDRWGGRLYFVYLPERDSCFDSSRTLADRTQVLSIVEAAGIPVIDLYPVFRSQRDPLALFPFRRLGHYNEKGHRLVGEEVLKAMSADRTAFVDRSRE